MGTPKGRWYRHSNLHTRGVRSEVYSDVGGGCETNVGTVHSLELSLRRSFRYGSKSGSF